MHLNQSLADEAAAAVAAALAPYAWRDFTDLMLARRVVGATDRHVVVSFVSSLPGIGVGAAEPVEPAEPDDARVDVLVRVLKSRRWRELSLDRLCVDLVVSLAVWPSERQAL
jgi:hypothetical protein